jgi:hypothetical protein
MKIYMCDSAASIIKEKYPDKVRSEHVLQLTWTSVRPESEFEPMIDENGIQVSLGGILVFRRSAMPKSPPGHWLKNAVAYRQGKYMGLFEKLYQETCDFIEVEDSDIENLMRFALIEQDCLMTLFMTYDTEWNTHKFLYFEYDTD